MVKSYVPIKEILNLLPSLSVSHVRKLTNHANTFNAV